MIRSWTFDLERWTFASLMTVPLYNKIGVASTFSPRFLQVLAEAKRIGCRVGGQLNLIYVGEETEETREKFNDAMERLALPGNSAVHYTNGDPAAAILDVCAAREIDLVIAGALEKEVILRPFLGNVARRLVREARCSVILFPKPDDEPAPFRRIVFMAEHSEHGQRAFARTLQLAAAENCERLFVVRVYTSFDRARAALREQSEEPTAARTLEEEEHALEQFIDAAAPNDVPIEARCIRGNTGYAALDFVQSMEADLLVVPVDPALPPGELPANVVWVTETIPCNLWVVR